MTSENKDMLVQLQGYRLTTAQIFYHMPDHPHLLQEFVWQKYDLAPKFPKLFKFLKFWEHEIDGSLHSVIVAKKELISPAQDKFLDGEFTLD